MTLADIPDLLTRIEAIIVATVLLTAVRAFVQRIHARQAHDAVEAQHSQAPMTAEVKRRQAMAIMGSAPALLRARPKRVAKLVQLAWRKANPGKLDRAKLTEAARKAERARREWP